MADIIYILDYYGNIPYELRVRSVDFSELYILGVVIYDETKGVFDNCPIGRYDSFLEELIAYIKMYG